MILKNKKNLHFLEKIPNQIQNKILILKLSQSNKIITIFKKKEGYFKQIIQA
jgi:hypothetical protein